MNDEKGKLELPAIPTAAPWSAEERDELFDSHPVLKWEHEVRIPTKPLVATAAVVSDCTYRSKNGRFFVGRPRHGKSGIIDFLRRAIRQAFVNVSVVVVEAAYTSRPSEIHMYNSILAAVGFSLPVSKRVDGLRTQVVNVLWSIAEGAGDRRIVLFVDEAQNWNGSSEWTWLKGILNSLRSLGVTLLVFPFGQSELIHVGTALRTAGSDDLRARFLNKCVKVYGLRSIEELRDAMEWLDERSEYPFGSKVPYTQFFFPRAFTTGMRLSQDADVLWNAFMSAGPDHEIGMEWIKGALQYMYVEYSADDSSDWRPTPLMWQKAVESSDWSSKGGIETEE